MTAFTTRQLSVPAYERGQSPYDICPREPNETWFVPIEPIVAGKPIKWATANKDSQVSIPLLPYLLNPDPAAAFAFAAQLGLAAAAEAREWQPRELRIRRIHISLGMPLQTIHDEKLGEMLQLQIGFGLVF